MDEKYFLPTREERRLTMSEKTSARSYEDAGYYIVRSFIICTVHQILLG
jgi:hypothetical protein